jgi:hypothetical protein
MTAYSALLGRLRNPVREQKIHELRAAQAKRRCLRGSHAERRAYPRANGL